MTMNIDSSVLIQVYSTVLAGVLIFMTVQRLFEWKERFEEKSFRLLQLRENALRDREEHEDDLNRLEVTRREGLVSDRELYEQPNVIKGYQDAKKRFEGLIRMKDNDINRITTDINSLGVKYAKVREQHARIKELERFLNVVIVALIVISIIVVLLVMPPYGGIISIITFSVGVIILIMRVLLHGEEVDKARTARTS